MLKYINRNNFLVTPVKTIKKWNLNNNVHSESLILLEGTSSSVDYLALEYVNYNNGDPVLNTSCSIALEQQENDLVFYNEGITASQKRFDPYNDERNLNGTYKRSVHNQIQNSFYNSHGNPFKILGIEYIDFPLGKTNRNLSNRFRLFTIPQYIFGDKIVPLSFNFNDNILDDNVTIADDGYQNLKVGFKIFSKIQEVKKYISPTGSNLIIDGNSSYSCPSYGCGSTPAILVGTVGYDSFDCYITESKPYPSSSSLSQTMNKFSGWNGAWYSETNYLGVQLLEDYETFITGPIV